MNRLREASLIEIACIIYLVFAALFVVWGFLKVITGDSSVIVDLLSVIIASSALFVAWRQSQITEATLTPYARFLQPHHNNMVGHKLTLFNAGLSTLTVHDITIEWGSSAFSLVDPKSRKSFSEETKGINESLRTYDVETAIPPTTQILVLGSDWHTLNTQPSMDFYNTIRITAYLKDYRGRKIEVTSKWKPEPHWSCMRAESSEP